MSRCNSCGKTIRWVRMVSGARRLMALDPEPVPSGTILMLPKREGRVVPVEERAKCVAPLFASHFATCPNADARQRCQPLRALSLTQPWAWLVVRPDVVDSEARARLMEALEIKNIENRTWNTTFRGRFLVHASKRMTDDDWMGGYYFAKDVGGLQLANRIPGYEALSRGGIVGVAELVDVLTPTATPTVPWHMPGQFGFVLANVEPLPFHPCKGSLGFWGDFDLRDGKVEQRAA